jgi:hypothetical protein
MSDLAATNSYIIAQSAGTGTFTVPVPGSAEQRVTLLGIQVDVSTTFVYVRYNLPTTVPFGYLQLAAGGVGFGNIPVQIELGTKEIMVDIVVAASTVILFFNVASAE